jgi:hypothetical protein
MKSILTTRGIAALMLVLFLSACGGGGGGSTADPGSTSTTPTTPAPAPAPTPAPTPAPAPSGPWSAPSGATPPSGNYIYLQSDNGDYIGAGRTYLYINGNALIKMSTNGLQIDVSVQGNQNWRGGFLLPSSAGTLQTGTFQNLTRTPFADRAVGGVEWSGDGRGCNNITGSVIIDKITLSGGVMTALDLRFEQHCEGSAPALRGQIHWTQADADSSQVTGPSAIPSGLWQPDAATLPASGNYLYLESRYGDFVGAGRTYLYTQANAIFKLNASGNYLGLTLTGDQDWSGDFKGMQAMSQLAPGYYGGLQRYPFNNPVLGGLSWSGEGRGCNTLSGWFVVDSISYSGSTLTAVDLRFEQYCDGNNAPLRGKLHWTANDSTSAAGPQSPPPAGLWTPGTAVAGVPGNYVYLVSDQGDYIGGGRTELLTPGNSTISVVSNLTAALRISAGNWSGDFFGMNTLSQLQPGYYGNLQRYPFHNPVRGGMDWSGNSRGCNTLGGWFVVDKVSYALGELTAIDLRFEQHCEGMTPALRGAIHWTK